MKKKQDNFIYKNFKSGLKYIKESKNYVWFSVYLFIFFILLGYILPVFFREQILKYIEALIKQTDGLNVFELIGFIINNNIWSAFSGLVFGILLGIIPLSVIIVNGYVLGFVANKVVAVEGVSSLWRLLPHGIFEIPAIIISVGLGLKLWWYWFYSKEKAKGFLAALVFFVCFIFSFMVLSLIISLFAGTSNPVALQNFYQEIMKNSLIVLLIFSICFAFIFISSYVSMKVFSKKERIYIMDSLKSNIKNSFRTFVFIIIPLLVIAGIIEGVLIWALG